jgi:hypothetical protein
MIEAKVRNIIGWLPVPAHIRSTGKRRLIRREYQKEILELKKRGDHEAVERKEDDRRSEMQLIFEEQEHLYSDRLIQKSRRQRVPVPREPKWIDSEGAV